MAVRFAPKHAVPIFPLPGIVLFPHTVLPLHVFELRYRTMVRETLSGERVIVLALLKPGWERDYRGSPEFYPLGCLARFDEVEWLPNDCYDLKVRGLARVEIGAATREYPYRAAQVRLRTEEPLSEGDPLIQLERRALADAYRRLAKFHEVAAGLAPPDESASYEALVNAVCLVVDVEPLERLALLETDSVLERGRRVRELIEASLRAEERRPQGGGEHN